MSKSLMVAGSAEASRRYNAYNVQLTVESKVSCFV
jgi:hypothetical protein